MDQSALGLSYARREFERSLKELKHQTTHPLPPENRSIHMGRIDRWGFFLAGQIDSNSTTTPDFRERRKVLWDNLARAQSAWDIVFSANRQCGDEASARAVLLAENDILGAWEELTTIPS